MGLLKDRINNKLEKGNKYYYLINEHELNREPVHLRIIFFVEVWIRSVIYLINKEFIFIFIINWENADKVGIVGQSA